MRSGQSCKLDFEFSVTLDHEIAWFLVFADKENEFSVLISKIFQGENELQWGSTLHQWKRMKNAKQQAITDLNVLNGYRDV